MAVTDVIARSRPCRRRERHYCRSAPRRLNAALVVGADGAQSTVAQRIGATYSRVGTIAGADHLRRTGPAPPWTGMRGHFEPGSCSGVFPTNGGAAWVFGTGALLEATQSSTMRTRRGRRGYIRRACGPGWALVGDAGHFEDPILAHGLSSALRDAELLARAVTTGFGRDRRSTTHSRDYERTRNRLGVPLFEVVDRIAGQQWDDAEIARLLLQLGSAMAHEVDALAALEPDVGAMSGPHAPRRLGPPRRRGLPLRWSHAHVPPARRPRGHRHRHARRTRHQRSGVLAAAPPRRSTPHRALQQPRRAWRRRVAPPRLRGRRLRGPRRQPMSSPPTSLTSSPTSS